MSDFLDLVLGLVEEGGDRSRVADVAVPLKLGADFDSLVPPEIPTDVPAGCGVRGWIAERVSSLVC